MVCELGSKEVINGRGFIKSKRVYDFSDQAKRKAAMEEASKKVMEGNEEVEENDQGIIKKVMKASEYKIMD